MAFVSACGITERVVDESASGSGGNAVLGASSGTGGGGSSKAGANAIGGKPDFNAPDPLFPKFENDGACVPGTTNVPSAIAGAGGEPGVGGTADFGAAGAVAERQCARASCASTHIAQIGKVGAVVADAGAVFMAELSKANGFVVGAGTGLGTKLIAALKSPATDLAVDGSWVYVQTATEIQKMARGSGELQTLASDQSPRGLAVDSTHLYFLSEKNGRRELRRILLATGAGEVLTAVDSSPMRIALDDESAYVLTKAELLQIPKCQEGPRVLAVTCGFGGGLAVDAGYAYWSSDNVLSRVSKDGSMPQAIFEDSPFDGEFVVSGSFVYWGNGDVLRAPVNGGPAEIIADQVKSPVVRAADDQYVYFVNAGNEVRAVPK